MSTKVYLASLMAKRFAGFPGKSEQVGDFALPDKVSDFTLSGKQQRCQKYSGMDKQWSTYENQNHGGPNIPVNKAINPLLDIKTERSSWHFERNSVPSGGKDNFIKWKQINYALKIFHVFLWNTVLTAAANLWLSEPKTNYRWKSRRVKKKVSKSSYPVSAKFPNLTSSHVLNVYADFIQLCRLTVLQTFERLQRESKNLLWKPKFSTYKSFMSVYQTLSDLPECEESSNNPSDISNLKQGATFSCANNIESDILSTSNRRTISEQASFSSTQANQTTTINQSATPRGNSTMDIYEIIAQELAALAGEVGDVFDGPLGRGDNSFDEINANILREDSISLPNLDDLDDSDFDPVEAEGGDYGEEYDSPSSYGSSPLPQMSPSPNSYEDHYRFFEEAHANYIANFDNQIMLSHNNFDASTESEDEDCSPTDPKRPRLSDSDQDPKSPTN